MSDSQGRRKTRRGRAVANREGRVYQRGSDSRWVGVVWPSSHPGGKPRYVYGRTRDEALTRKKDLERELASDEPTETAETVAHFFGRWFRMLEREVAAGNLAQSTLDSYRDNSQKHILPALGPVEIRRLSVSRVSQWQYDLSRTPSRRQRVKLRKDETELPPPVLLSPRTVAYCHAILRRALGDAMRDEVVRRNVATLVRPHRERRPAKRGAAKLTKDDTRKLLDAASTDPLWCYWLTVLSLGLRRGEGLALRWDDIDFDNRRIRLEATVQRVRVPDPATGSARTRLVRKELKTAGSQDVLPAGTGLLEALRKHQKQQAAERMKSPSWLDTRLVFTTGIGTALEPRNVARAWARVCERAGVAARIHDLRHATGDYAVAAGVHQRVIQGLLRHSRLSTTEIYMDVLDEVRRDAVDKLDSVVFTELMQPGRGQLIGLPGGAG